MLGKSNKVVRIPPVGHYGHGFETKKPRAKRVCAYCRVSTNEDAQLSSYDLQVQHYTHFISSNPEWEYAGVYADYAKSGTSTEKRTEFLRMIEDCKRQRIDQVITKSISRFARNTLDCLNYVRQLQSLRPPVGIYFEKENINTLDAQGELLLTILSSIAQEEARSISENSKWSIRKRFQAGKPRCPTKFLLGYDKDKDGNLMINEQEAKTVQRVYRDYMEGKGAKLIAAELKAEGFLTARGTINWGKTSILNMLRNERYCGDVLMQKSYTVDFLNHKQKPNKGQVTQYYIENHHPAIIPREEWDAVQAEIKRRHQIVAVTDPGLRQGYSSTSVISNHLFCGHCGQPLIRHTATLRSGGKNERIPVWRCRATWKKSRIKAGCEQCHAKRQQEPKIKAAFMEMLIRLKEQRAELGLQGGNGELKGILDSLDDRLEFKDEYFRLLVERGMVYDEGKIEYSLKSGLVCTSYLLLASKYHLRPGSRATQ